MMEEAGFVDFEQRTICCYVNPWSPFEKEREIAKWFNAGLRDSLQALGLMPMIEKLGMTKKQVEVLCNRAIEENTKLQYHGYCNM